MDYPQQHQHNKRQQTIMASSEEELESYSSEEVEQQQSENEYDNTENDAAIAEILEENELLEQTEAATASTVRKTASGKHKAAKITASQTVVQSPNYASLSKTILALQKEVDTLKRVKKSPEKRKIDVNTDQNAYDNAQCSSSGVPPKPKKLKISINNNKQLSSASSNQLSPGKSQQLSTARTKQLSPAKKSSVPQGNNNDINMSSDDEVALHVNRDNDPLAQEVNAENAAGDSDGDSSEDEGNDNEIFEDLVSAISVGCDDELLSGEPLLENWAKKLNSAWKTKQSKTYIAGIMQKYRTPSNLTDFRIPKMNKDIWDLCTKWHRKADLNMSASQRALVKATTAVLKLNDYLCADSERSVRQIAMQTTADVVSLLGKVNRELSLRRKTATRSVLKGDYKKLATNSTNVTENLFGDNITQDIKDINTKRRIAEQSNRRNYGSYNNNFRGGYHRGGYRGANNNYNNHFLWDRRGRGRQYRASHTTTTFNNQQKKH